MTRHAGWLAAALLVPAVPCAGAQTQPVESRITAVTVFPDRAEITRQASLSLEKGARTLRLGPLPASLEPSSVSVRGSGRAQVTLYGAHVVTSQLEEAQHPKLQELEEDIRETQHKQQALQHLKAVLEHERDYLRSIQAASSEQIGKDLITKSPSASDAQALLDFLDRSFLSAFEREQKADAQLEELARQLDKLNRELASLAGQRQRQQMFIDVDLEATDGGAAFQVEVSYRVLGATWQPLYVARARTGADEVELASFAQVQQQTGEGWEEVALTLSTARPAIAGSMPQPQPWFLRPWEPMPAAKSLGGLMRQDALEEVEAPREAQVGSAAVAAQGPAVTFGLPKPVTIAADWQPHKVPLNTTVFKAQLAYEAAPRLMPHAFLRAKVTNAGEALYLAGQLSVFLDGAFVATAFLEQVAPQEEFDLYLGVDERVRVEHKQLKDRVEVSLLPGLRGKMKSTDVEYLTTIENYAGRRISLTVFDQIPVSQREEITVESVRMTPAEVEKDPEKPGVFHWTVELLPSQKQELTLAYRIRHPVDMQVQ